MRKLGNQPSEEFNTDDFFTNDFLKVEDVEEEIGASLDISGDRYLSGSERLRLQALRWLGVRKS